MLGPAEFREISEAMTDGRGEREGTSPYLTPGFAMGVSLARVMTGNRRSTETPAHK